MTPNMNMANAYKTQQILTASPEQLTLMLYNGAIKFVDETIMAVDRKDFAKAHERNLRAQEIIREFMATLDMQYEVSKNWMALYDYIEFRLIQGNIKKDKEQLQEARNYLQELRDTWVEAMKKARTEHAVPVPQMQAMAR